MSGGSDRLVAVDGDTVVRDVAARRRYTIAVGGVDAGFVGYLDEGEHRVFLHTEVQEEFEGHGVAARLVQAVLDDVRERGSRAVNFCPYITAFLRTHHDWDDLVDRPTPAILARVREQGG